jgi:type IV secretion system protein TrbG
MTNRSSGIRQLTGAALLGAAVVFAAARPAAAIQTASLNGAALASVKGGRDTGGASTRGSGFGAADSAGIRPTSAVNTDTLRTGSSVDQITAAARDYQRTGVARTVEEGAFVTFPYGHAQPTVTCAPLRVCVIELQAGESVLSKIAGDTQRWEIQLAPAGSDGRTPLIVVKPHDCGLTTNLVLATTAGRIYDMTLDSPPCPRSGVNPHGVYIRHVRFYYPDAMVQAWTTPSTAPPAAATIVSSTSAARIDALNFGYKVHRDRGFPWSPLAVFDDGVHCYIKLPPLAAHRDAAVLFMLREDGTKTLLNYSLSGDTYVTDRIFHVAVLVIGESGQERAVRLENLRYDAGSGSENTSDSASEASRAGGGG